MFSLSYDTPCEIQGTIRVAKPVYSLGNITDVEGKQWNVRGIYGKTILAVPMNDLHPYFNDTSGRSFGMVSQTWKPYATEIVEQP